MSKSYQLGNYHSISNINGNDIVLQNDIIRMFKWVEWLVLYLPSWTIKMPNYKSRSLCVNIIGIIYTFVPWLGIFVLTIIQSIQAGISVAGVPTLAVNIIATFAKGMSIYYFMFSFHFSWYNLLNKMDVSLHTNIKTKIKHLNARLLVMFFVALIMILAGLAIMIINNERNIVLIISALWNLTCFMPIIIEQICISIALFKYEIYLDILQQNMTKIEDIDNLESEYMQMCWDMKNMIKSVTLYYVGYFGFMSFFIIVSSSSMITEIQDVLSDVGMVFGSFFLIIPLIEFCVSTSKISSLYVECVNQTKLSNKNQRTIYLILIKSPLIVKLLGIECSKQNYIRLVCSLIFSKAVLYVFSYYIPI